VITSDWKMTLLFCMKKLVRENDLFCPGKLGKSQRKWILQRSRNHAAQNYHMLVMMLAMQLMMIKNFFREFYIPKSNYINLDVQIQFVKTFLLKESLMSGTVYHLQSAFLLFPHSRDHWRILILRPIWNVLCRPAAIFVCFYWFYDLILWSILF